MGSLARITATVAEDAADADANLGIPCLRPPLSLPSHRPCCI